MHNTTTSIDNPDSEFYNIDSIADMMLGIGHTSEETDEALYNMYHYGSPGSPNDIPDHPPSNLENYVFSEEFQRFLDGLDAKMAEALMK